MLGAFKKNYLPDRNYTALYLHSFFKQMAISVIFAFTGAWMFSFGIKLEYVLLFFAADYFLIGVFSPLGLKFTTRFGVFYTELASSICLLLGCFSIALIEQNILFILPGTLLRALGFGLANPVYGVLQAIYFEDHNRGKSFTLMLVLTSVASIAGIGAAGWLVSTYAFLGIAAFCAVFLLIGAWPFAMLEERIKGTLDIPLKDAYRAPFKQDFRPYFYAFMGEQFTFIGKIVLVPILLYFYVHDFRVMSGIIMLAVLAETIILLALGSWSDRSARSAPVFWATSTNATALLFYALAAKTPLLLFVADTWHRLGHNAFTATFRSAMHKHIRHSTGSMILFGTSWQMALCMSEAITLPLMALIAWQLQDAALPVLLGICAGGLFLAYARIRKISAQPTDKAA